MRILVVGAGATGGFYGGRLFQAGRDVSFLVRPARAGQLRAHGLRIASPYGDATLHPPLLTAATLAQPFDLVLLCVKSYAIEQALADMVPAVGPNTLIMPVLNGMQHVALLAERFGAAAVLGGVSHVATTLDDQGGIVQFEGPQRLTYGALAPGLPGAPSLQDLHATMSGANFDAVLSPQIEQDLWDKWIRLATLGGITCLLGGTIGDIEATPGGASLARQLLHECVAAATACGHPPSAAYVADTEAFVTTPGSPLVSSMYRDLQKGHAVESEAILGDLARRAQANGVTTPLLAAANARLCIYSRALSR